MYHFETRSSYSMPAALPNSSLRLIMKNIFIFVLFFTSHYCFADAPEQSTVVQYFLSLHGLRVHDVIVNNAEDPRYRFGFKEVFFEVGLVKYNCYVTKFEIEPADGSEYRIRNIELSQCVEYSSQQKYTLNQIKKRHPEYGAPEMSTQCRNIGYDEIKESYWCDNSEIGKVKVSEKGSRMPASIPVPVKVKKSGSEP